jgi:DNA (cytosine-5)-methyltransferase 1
MGLKLLDLCSGIGGISKAAEWAGIETVGFCEINKFCQKVLKKNWPDVPIFDDIKTLNREVLDNAGIGRINIMAAGYPCQPYSLAGERKGEDDDRALWPYLFENISELRPDWFVGENVAGHVSLGLDNVLSDLESIEYTAQSFIIPACSVGARHLRYRIFTVANNDSERMERSITRPILWEPDLSARQVGKPFQEAERRYDTYQSRLCRSLHRLPGGVDRVRSLGNAVVPQQIYPIFAAITEIERIKELVKAGA